MKKFFHFLIGLSVSAVLVIGLIQILPVVRPNVGWNGRLTATALSIKTPPFVQPNVGWNT